jgi:hypothetical protein
MLERVFIRTPVIKTLLSRDADFDFDMFNQLVCLGVGV